MRPPFLGELEAAVMDHVWREGRVDVKAVHKAIRRARPITLNTVQSTMERLHRKGLLTREKVSHAYVYSPGMSREQFGARLVKGVIDSTLAGKTQSMLSAFVDLVARAGEAELDRLERMIAEHRAGKGRRG